jgi:hypothetical protein
MRSSSGRVTSSTGIRAAGDRQHLLDAVVHLDALGDVERRRGDLGAQRLEHGVAPGHVLGVVAADDDAAVRVGSLRLLPRRDPAALAPGAA